MVVMLMVCMIDDAGYVYVDHKAFITILFSISYDPFVILSHNDVHF